jgi:hypothetical protein
MTNMAHAIRINHAPEPNPRPINLISLVKKMRSKSGKRCVFASRSGGWDWLWNASVSSPLFLNDIVLCQVAIEELDAPEMALVNPQTIPESL